MVSLGSGVLRSLVLSGKAVHVKGCLTCVNAKRIRSKSKSSAGVKLASLDELRKV